MASITNLSDVFKYIVNNFGSSNRWQNGNALQSQAVNITDTAATGASNAAVNANANAAVNANANAAVNANANAAVNANANAAVNANANAAVNANANAAVNANANAAVNANANAAVNANANAAVKSDTAVVSSAAQTASSLHSQIKSTGSENAAIFRSALTSLVSNFSSNSATASGTLGSFLGFGVAMAETGNLKTYTDMSLMVTSLSQLTSSTSALASKSINQTQLSFQSFGVETAGSYINSAQKIMSAGLTDGANKGFQVSTLNSLNKLWEKTSNLSGVSVEQKTGMLANIAANIESKGSLSELNDYLKQQLEAMAEEAEQAAATEEAEEESLTTASQEDETEDISNAVNANYANGSYSRSSFVAGNTAVDGFQSALQASTLNSVSNLVNYSQNISAYKNNMNVSVASTLLDTGV